MEYKKIKKQLKILKKKINLIQILPSNFFFDGRSDGFHVPVSILLIFRRKWY